MTDTKDVAYVRERLCMASDVLNDVFVKTKEMSEENAQLKELLKECRKCFELLTNDNSPWCPPEADTLLVKINQVLGEE